MEDSNPQETIADLHVGFLDRCATITPIFRIAGLSRLSLGDKAHAIGTLVKVAPLVVGAGLEPATYGLSGHRSAI